uniref:Uncharacterized protein n=1 Tax=Octopus bimaculoides TaxID=37653 RepID=A0A0L8FFA8_OCTBM
MYSCHLICNCRENSINGMPLLPCLFIQICFIFIAASITIPLPTPSTVKSGHFSLNNYNILREIY